jgi:hypothetical protein
MIGGGILGMIKRALNAEGCDPPKPRLIGCFMPSSIITALHGVDGQWLKICSRFQRGGHGGVVEPLGGAHSQLNRVAQQLNEWSSETLGFETRPNEI